MTIMKFVCRSGQIIMFLEIISATNSFNSSLSQRFIFKDHYLKKKVSHGMVNILTVICTLFFCVWLRFIITKLKLKFSVSPFMLLAGIFVGYMFYIAEKHGSFGGIVIQHQNSLLIIVVPIMIYNMCVTFDANLLAKCWGQIFIIAIPGLLINMCLVALIFNRISSNWRLSRGFLLAVMFAPIYPMDMMVYLKNVGAASTHVLTILQGESLIGTCIAFMLHHIILETDLEMMFLWWHYLWLLFICLVVGIIVGYISGRIISCMMLFFGNDPIQTILISWVGPFTIFYVVTVVSGSGPGLVTLSVQGIIVARGKRSLSKESKRTLETFWDCMALGANSCGLLLIGIVAGYETLGSAGIEDVAFIMLVYLINLVARLLEFLVIFHLLRIVGYGITFNHMIVLVWGGIFSFINLSLIMFTYDEPEYDTFTEVSLFHGVGSAFLTMIINVTTIPYLLNCLELNTISLIKQANMNKCIKHITAIRGHTIAILKLERFLCDANWPFIHEATVITHPFKMENIKKYEELENELEFEKVAICPECHREATIISTMKELEDLIKDAKRRILKAKQVSYSRQYENGMLTIEAIRVLMNEVENAIQGDFVINVANIVKLFNPPKHLIRFRLLLFRVFHGATDEWFLRRPRITFRKICYSIVFNIFFEDVMFIIILLNSAMVITEFVLRFKEPEVWNRRFTRYLIFKSFSLVFFVVYVMEFVLKVLALSIVYIWKDGVVSYFRSKWRRLEFFCLITSAIVVICEVVELVSDEKQIDYPSGFVIFICCLGALRITRLARVVHRVHPFVEKCIDGSINNRITLAYSVGKGYITGEQDVLHLLPTIVLKRELIEEMKSSVEADRLAITKELGLIQRERPWVAINVKTREAIKTTLNAMYEAITELKLKGWVDEVEREKLKHAIAVQESKIRRLGFVGSNAPRMIFEETSWMGQDEKLLKYLWVHSKKVNFDPGEYVCIENEPADGIYIVISGLFKLTYLPDDKMLKDFYKCGNLPIIDLISSPDFDSGIEDFIMGGNSFGELSILTDRPYSCSIMADCHSQVFLIEKEFVLEAMSMDSNPIFGLKARMWTAISLKLAFGILVKVPAYFAVTKKEIEFSLLRAVVPDLDGVTIFHNNNMIEDIILINGLVMDFNSRVIYYAPCYIPRNVQKIVFSSSRIINRYLNVGTDIQTKLLLITENDVDISELMSIIERTAEYAISDDLSEEYSENNT